MILNQSVVKGIIVSKLADGIIYAEMPPVLDEEAATTFINELKGLINNDTRKSRIITDVNNMQGMPSLAAKDIIVAGIKSHRSKIEKSAVCGFSKFGLIAARLIITLAGRGDIKVFQEKDKAFDWVRL